MQRERESERERVSELGLKTEKKILKKWNAAECVNNNIFLEQNFICFDFQTANSMNVM